MPSLLLLLIQSLLKFADQCFQLANSLLQRLNACLLRVGLFDGTRRLRTRGFRSLDLRSRDLRSRGLRPYGVRLGRLRHAGSGISPAGPMHQQFDRAPLAQDNDPQLVAGYSIELLGDFVGSGNGDSGDGKNEVVGQDSAFGRRRVGHHVDDQHALGWAKAKPLPILRRGWPHGDAQRFTRSGATLLSLLARGTSSGPGLAAVVSPFGRFRTFRRLNGLSRDRTKLFKAAFPRSGPLAQGHICLDDLPATQQLKGNLPAGGCLLHDGCQVVHGSNLNTVRRNDQVLFLYTCCLGGASHNDFHHPNAKTAILTIVGDQAQVAWLCGADGIGFQGGFEPFQGLRSRWRRHGEPHSDGYTRHDGQ